VTPFNINTDFNLTAFWSERHRFKLVIDRLSDEYEVIVDEEVREKGKMRTDWEFDQQPYVWQEKEGTQKNSDVVTSSSVEHCDKHLTQKIEDFPGVVTLDQASGSCHIELTPEKEAPSPLANEIKCLSSVLEANQ